MTAIERMQSAAPETSGYETEKPADQIEADIVGTRARLGETIGALEQKLSPQRFIEHAGSGALGVIEAQAQHLKARLREKALPLLLIAAGIALLLLPEHDAAPREQRALPGPPKRPIAQVPPEPAEAMEPAIASFDRAAAGDKPRVRSGEAASTPLDRFAEHYPAIE
jgi:hypothetical protein